MTEESNVKQTKSCLKTFKITMKHQNDHYMKSVRIRSFSGPYFPAFRLNTKKIHSISPYSVQMWENTDQKNYEYGHFSRKMTILTLLWLLRLVTFVLNMYKGLISDQFIPCKDWLRGNTGFDSYIFLTSSYTKCVFSALSNIKDGAFCKKHTILVVWQGSEYA